MQFAYICVNMCVRVHVHMLVCLHAHAVIFEYVCICTRIVGLFCLLVGLFCLYMHMLSYSNMSVYAHE